MPRPTKNPDGTKAKPIQLKGLVIEEIGEDRSPEQTKQLNAVLRDGIRLILHNENERFQKKLWRLNPKDYVSAYLSLLRFSIPTLSASMTELKTPEDQTIVVQLEGSPPPLSSLSLEEQQAELDKLPGLSPQIICK